MNESGIIVCKSCPTASHRTLLNGNCTCNIGYFDDNRTTICEKCANVLSNCLTCTNRYKCTSCDTGMFTDKAQSICTQCRPPCLTCGVYFDECTNCDSSKNRILSNKKCVCISSAYEKDNACKLCKDAIANCNSC